MSESLRGIWHVGFQVSDLNASIVFYSALLGMVVVHRQEQDNAYTRSLVGYPDAVLRVAQLALPGRAAGLPGTHDLELVEYVVPRREPVRTERCQPGTTHLAFVVDDIWDDYRRLEAHGVTFVSPPNEITAGVNSGGACCYFLDPDRITLELVQAPG